jgi:acetylornithine deacetylase/succinyl-diaminopimelate desuccinylase-like protein
VYASFTLTVKNAGGHSSLPTKDNAINRLATGLQRLAHFEFPVRMNETTRAYFKNMAPTAATNAADMRVVANASASAAELKAAAARLSASSPFYNALLRTTCVPTMLQGGHAENALPQTAQATVNCRLLPDEDPSTVQRTLVRVLADREITVAPVAPATPSPPSPLARDVFKGIETATRLVWGGGAAGSAGQATVPIVPFMETGATDGLLLRNAGMPVYGVSGIPYDPDDYRAHGKDERILVKSFDEGLAFIYQLAKALAGPAAASP